MFKRLNIVVLAMLFLLAVPSQVLAASSSLELSTSSSSIVNGSEFNVTMMVNSSVPVSGVFSEVTFNPGQISYVSRTEYATSFPILWGFTPDSGTLSETRSSDTGVSGKKVVITYRFKAIIGSGQTTITATGSANAGGSEVTLAKGTLNLSLTSSSTGGGGSAPPTSSPGATASSGAGSTDTSANPENTTTSQNESLTEDSESANGASTASNPVSKTFEGISNIATSKNKLPLVIIVIGLLALGGGGWYLLHRRKMKLQAGHFPDVKSAPPNIKSDLHTNIFTGTNLGAESTILPSSQNLPKTPTGDPIQSAPFSTQSPVQPPQPPVPEGPIPSSSVVEPFVITPTQPPPPAPVVAQPTPESNIVVMPERSMAEPNDAPKTY